MRAIGSKRTGRIGPLWWTVRFRLTLLYGVLFLASGIALLAITYMLMERNNTLHMVLLSLSDSGAGGDLAVMRNRVQQLIAAERAACLRHMLVNASIALGIMVAFSIALGW